MVAGGAARLHPVAQGALLIGAQGAGGTEAGHIHLGVKDIGMALGVDGMTAQGMTWYYEHGILKDCNTDREGFTVQVAEEFLAAYRMYHDEWGYSPWITDWDNVGIKT